MKKITTSPYIPTEIEIEEIDEKTAKISAYPFESGFAITLAHPLRRLLLSSTVGYAPTALYIEGVSHEFDSVRGMFEDVAHFIINLKNMRFKIKNDENMVELNYSFKGHKEIKGSDLENDLVEVVTPDNYLATLNEDGNLNFTIIVQKGIGYVPSENIREGLKENFIALDAFFTPVRKAVYDIEKILIEDNPNYEKVVFVIETDGQVTPVEAFKNALVVMYDQMSIFNKVLNLNIQPKIEHVDTKELNKLLRKIDELELSVRSFNCLEKANIQYIGELALMSEQELKNLKNLGKKSLEEIKEVMNKEGYPIDQELSADMVKALSEKIQELKSKSSEEKK
ncbi:MAG: DNA-directed RNA polymerase subunit alpha [Epsilonproteobacteria bacterium]|nr:DNA-directed RNA polymerase subunit alpha [Campylobacterota bacterium]